MLTPCGHRVSLDLILGLLWLKPSQQAFTRPAGTCLGNSTNARGLGTAGTLGTGHHATNKHTAAIASTRRPAGMPHAPDSKHTLRSGHRRSTIGPALLYRLAHELTDLNRVVGAPLPVGNAVNLQRRRVRTSITLRRLGDSAARATLWGGPCPDRPRTVGSSLPLQPASRHALPVVSWHRPHLALY